MARQSLPIHPKLCHSLTYEVVVSLGLMSSAMIVGGGCYHPRHPYPPNEVFYSTPQMELLNVSLWGVVKWSKEALDTPTRYLIETMT